MNFTYTHADFIHQNVKQEFIVFWTDYLTLKTITFFLVIFFSFLKAASVVVMDNMHSSETLLLVLFDWTAKYFLSSFHAIA